MRKRYPLAALAAIGLTAATGLVHAHADPERPAAPPPAAGPVGAVVLPTGDVVRLTADGSYITEPRDADAAFQTTVEDDGDRLVIPVESLPGLASGEYTFEQFNIDALARNGISDAAAPDARDLLADEAEDETAAGAVEVAFTGRWSDGSAPASSSVEWVELDTGASDYIVFDGGAGTLELAPGHYHLTTMLAKTAEKEAIAGVLDVTVDADGGSVVFDGAEARTAGFALDRETTTRYFQLRAFSHAPGTADGASVGVSGRGWTVAAVPTDMDLCGRDVGMSLRAELTGPAGAEPAYSYSLSELAFDGIPEDPVFRIADEDLARIDMDYQSLGIATEMGRMNLATHPVYTASGYFVADPVPLPSHRTEFYSADPELAWSHLGQFEAEDAPSAEVLHHSGALEAGSVTETTWNRGPVTTGVDLAGAEYYYPRFVRNEEFGELFTNPALFSSGAADEAAFSYDLPGITVLSQDGREINRSSAGGSLATDLALVPEGRYTLRTEASRSVPWTPLGTAAIAEWEFFTSPDEEIPAVAVVDFDAEGIENGYADRSDRQDVVLEFVTQPGAVRQDCTAMTFEVSYNDGESWEAVAINREGNTATAALDHPDDAAFVSVRFSATDAAGNTVRHSTIRSYGLQ